MKEAPSPFFVFGPQKCGSSLLSTLMEQHPDVAIAVDSVVLNNFFDWLMNHKARDIDFHPEQDNPGKYFERDGLRRDLLRQEAGYDEVKWFLAILLNRYFSTSVNRLQNLLHLQGEGADREFLFAEEMLPYEHGLTLDPGPVLDRVKEGCAWTDVLAEIIRQLAYSNGKKSARIYGEKTPGHMRFAHFLEAAYPSARFIVMVREPLANIASYYKRNNRGFAIRQEKGDVEECIRIYKGFMDPFLAFYQQKRERFLVVRYEDLLNDPQATMDGVFRHLGLAPQGIDEAFRNGSKGVYVGGSIDRERAKGAYVVLTDDEKERVRKGLDYVYREFYPEKWRDAA